MAAHIFAIDAELSRLDILEALAVASRQLAVMFTVEALPPGARDRARGFVEALEAWRAALVAVYPELKEASGGAD